MAANSTPSRTHVNGEAPPLPTLDARLAAIDAGVREQSMSMEEVGRALAEVAGEFLASEAVRADLRRNLNDHPSAVHEVILLVARVDLPAAINFAQEALEDDVQQLFLADALVRMLLAADAPDLAKDYAEQMVAGYPELAVSHERLAEALVAKGLGVRLGGDIAAANELFQRAYDALVRATELTPDDANDWLFRAKVARFRGDYPTADRDATRAIELQPAMPDAYNVRGLGREAAGNLTGALGDYSKAMELAPEWAEATRNVADAQFGLGDDDAAQANYLRAHELDPDDIFARLGLARFHYRKGEWTEILEILPADEANPVTIADVGNLRGLAFHELAARDPDRMVELGHLAVAEFDTAARLSPTNSAVLYNRARTWQLLADWERAIADCTAAMGLAPQDPDIPFMRAVVESSLATAAFDRGDHDEAARLAVAATADYRRTAELEPAASRGPLYMADLTAYLERWDEAKDQYTAALALDGELTRAYFGRGIARSVTSDYAGAIADFAEVVRRDPDNVAAYTQTGLAHASLIDLAVAGGRTDDIAREQALARQSYDAAIERDASASEARIQRAVLQMWEVGRSGLGDDATAPKIREAYDDLTRAIEAAPTSWSAYHYRGQADILLGDFELATADYGRAIELNPASVDSWTNRGIAYERMRDYANALADYEHVSALTPDQPQAWINVGDARLGLDDRDGAVAAYEKAIDLDQAAVAAWSGRARARIANGEIEAGVRDLDAALALSPRNAALYLNRADQLAALLDYDRALWDYDRAISLAPDDVDAYRGRSYAQLQLGFGFAERRRLSRAAKAYTASVEDARRTIELGPEDPWAHRYEGYGLRALDAYDWAADSFARAAALADEKDVLRWELLADEADARQTWGRELRIAEPTQQAIKEFRAIVRHARRSMPDIEGRARRGLGDALLDSGQPKDALKTFSDLQRAAPDDARLAVAIGTCELQLDRPDRARTAFRHALDHDAVGQGIDLYARVGLSVALRRTGRASEAGRALRTGASRPTTGDRVDRSTYLYELGEPAAAITEARAAVSRAPDEMNAHNQLSWMLAVAGRTPSQHAEAISVGRRAVALAEDPYAVAQTLDTLGWALFVAGEIDEAVLTLQKAVDEDGYAVVLRWHLEQARKASVAGGLAHPATR